MKGDFSQWRFDPGENFTGVLQQQGKVLLDSDWNEHTRIHTHWQDQAGQDAIGPDVAAVPTGAPDGFKILAARVVTGSGDPFVQGLRANLHDLKTMTTYCGEQGMLDGPLAAEDLFPSTMKDT